MIKCDIKGTLTKLNVAHS